jgi:hypothetical protein
VQYRARQLMRTTLLIMGPIAERIGQQPIEGQKGPNGGFVWATSGSSANAVSTHLYKLFEFTVCSFGQLVAFVLARPIVCLRCPTNRLKMLSLKQKEQTACIFEK